MPGGQRGSSASRLPPSRAVTTPAPPAPNTSMCPQELAALHGPGLASPKPGACRDARGLQWSESAPELRPPRRAGQTAQHRLRATPSGPSSLSLGRCGTEPTVRMSQPAMGVGRHRVSRAAVTQAPGSLWAWKAEPTPRAGGLTASLVCKLSVDTGALFRQAAVKDTGRVEVSRGPLWYPWTPG